MVDKKFPKDLQEAQAALSSAVYAATSLLEDWESAVFSPATAIMFARTSATSRSSCWRSAGPER